MIDPKLRAWRLLLTVHAELIEQLSEEMSREFDGLPLTWYEVLLLVYEADGRLRMHALAESLLLSRSGATRFVDRMVDAGLVAREAASDDRRGVFVVLTEPGRSLFARAAPVHLAGIRKRFTDHISDEEAAVMAAALERTLAAAGGD